jgi:hypothetical protein
VEDDACVDARERREIAVCGVEDDACIDAREMRD